MVFTEYADTAEWLVAMFREQKFTAKQYSGSQNHSERAAIQKEFMTGRFEVIVSTDAGNEGIDLQAAHVLVNWDIPWSLVRLEQRMGRIHRIGQEHKVDLYNIIALGTREGDAHERLLDRLIEAANELKRQDVRQPQRDHRTPQRKRIDPGHPRTAAHVLRRRQRLRT